MAINFCQT